MSSQRDDEVVYAIGGVIRSQDNRLVLPLVLLCVSIAAVLADLRKRLVFLQMKLYGPRTVIATHLGQLQTAEWLLLFEQIAERGTNANEG